MLLIIIVGLALTITASWFSIHQITQKTSAQTKTNHNTNEPNSVIINAHYIHTNAQGQITEKLTSPKIISYKQNDKSVLQTPHLILYGNKAPWIITADIGISLDDSQKIILKDNVKIVQHNPNGNTVFTTNEITVWPKKKFARTEQLVTIKQPGSIVKGQGMTVDMNTAEVKLLNNARGQYEPQPAAHNH